MSKAKSDRIVEWLMSIGCMEQPSKSRYRKFSRPGKDGFYFVGRNGALRAGKTASGSVSLSYTPAVKRL